MEAVVTNTSIGDGRAQDASLTDAAARAAGALLRSGRPEEAVPAALQILGPALAAGFAGVFQYQKDGEAEQWPLRYHWSAKAEVVPDEFARPEGCVSQLRDGRCVHADDRLLVPLRAEGRLWGSLCFEAAGAEAGAEAGADWSRAEALTPFADGLAHLLYRHSAVRRQEVHLKRRLRMERVLGDVTQLFVSPGRIEAEALLRAVGQATEADRVYLITAPPDDRPDETAAQADGASRGNLRDGRQAAAAQSAHIGWPTDLHDYTYCEWYAAPETASEDRDETGREDREDREDWATLAVPVLSPQGKLYGYLGIEYREAAPMWLVEEKRLLDVLGDVLSAYLERQMAEAALRASEERYRSFVSTISEGIWCVEPAQPVDTAAPAEAQQEALHSAALVAECNASMARVLGAATPEEVLGRPAAEVLPGELGRRFFADFVAQGYSLRNREYSVEQPGADPHHFVTNAVGVVEEDRLVRLWGSWTDVTGRVELERRMVTALEQQQQRIGHELHDGVGQLITSVGMLSQNLADRYFAEGDAGYEQAQRVVRFTCEASQLLRELQRGLAPIQVQGRGLAQSLEQLARNTDELPGITCVYDHDGRAEVSEREAKLQLYRIAQEAANNALKHAEASHLRISLHCESGGIVLEVQDNGVGFDVEAHRDTSLGLHSMAYRARSVGGALRIDSDAEAGTHVRCHFPDDVA